MSESLTSLENEAATNPPPTRKEPVQIILRYPIRAANILKHPPQMYIKPKARVPIHETDEALPGKISFE